MTGLALDTAGVVSLIGEAADRLLDRGRSGIASSTVEIAGCDLACGRFEPAQPPHNH